MHWHHPNSPDGVPREVSLPDREAVSLPDHRARELSVASGSPAAVERGNSLLPDPPAEGVRRITGECDQLAAAYSNVAAEVIQTGPGSESGLMEIMPLSQANLHYVRNPVPTLVHASTPVRSAGLMVPAGPEMRHIVNAVPLTSNSFVGCGPAPEYFAQEPVGKDQFFAVFPEELVRTALAAATGQDTPSMPARVQVLEAEPAAFAGLRQTLRQIQEQAAKDPGLFSSADARRNMERALITSWVQAWVSARPLRNETGSRSRWYSDRNLKRALEYLDEHHDQPVYLLELCQMLGVSTRTLELLFKRNLGVGPMRYLKLRRLQQVRASLRAADPYWTSVKALALDAGFWDLGRFAREYRAQFKESPSTTLRKLGGFDPGTSRR